MGTLKYDYSKWLITITVITLSGFQSTRTCDWLISLLFNFALSTVLSEGGLERQRLRWLRGSTSVGSLGRSPRRRSRDRSQSSLRSRRHRAPVRSATSDAGSRRFPSRVFDAVISGRFDQFLGVQAAFRVDRVARVDLRSGLVSDLIFCLKMAYVQLTCFLIEQSILDLFCLTGTYFHTFQMTK